MSGPGVLRVVGAAGAAWGVVLLARGAEVWRAVDATRPGENERLATTALGARHVLQGLAQAAAPRLTVAPVIGVDLVHAASMAWLAGRDPRYRRPAVVSGGVALLSALVTATAAWASHASRSYAGSPPPSQ
ncbi:hypothetical protein N865_16050 [Intrasporangium oryzae NRRL B-24470]|uniref:DUF4267 domain-containing protein n=1 Tax=Intrasporangium oryzae NRRL B-24470 TaxID=1386089 RepID=W9G2L3_9MICO|nr:hypothetical protein [Intrasporangium oryzae]EWT00366.1 hypothetical protein N865_16050 [Intrasporangium oryzae NRRL B-24470]